MASGNLLFCPLYNPWQLEYTPREWLHNIVNALVSLNCTVLKRLSICYVNFTSIKKKKNTIHTSRLDPTSPAQSDPWSLCCHILYSTYFLCSSPFYAWGRNWLYPIPSCSENTSHTQDFCPSFSLGLEGSPQGLSRARSSSSYPSSHITHELTKDFPDHLIKSCHPFLLHLYIIFVTWDYVIYLFSFFPGPPHSGMVWKNIVCSPQHPSAWHIIDTS